MGTMARILLVYTSGVPNRDDPYISLLPNGLCSIHAYLCTHGHSSLLANVSGWTNHTITQRLSHFQPDIIGISQWTHNRHQSQKLARLFRTLFPQALIVCGGGHASFRYEPLLASNSPINVVVIGEGEATMGELADSIHNNVPLSTIRGIAYRSTDNSIQLTAPRPLLNNLDELPSTAAWFKHSVGVNEELQAEFVLTARGCPATCSFCSSPAFWLRSLRFRSPAIIVEELKNIRDRYGLIYFSLRDDTFTADAARVEEFCRLLIDSNTYILWNCQSRVSCISPELVQWMKRAGCECIQLGIESGAPRTLARLGKNSTPDQAIRVATWIREAGIHLSIYLISDIPGETTEDIRETANLIRTIRPHDGYVSPLAYYPGTRLFHDAVTSGAVAADIFETSIESALYVSPAAGTGATTLLSVLTSHRAGKTRNKTLSSDCWTTDVINGEDAHQRHHLIQAEACYLRITRTEPKNPWGWYLLAELYQETGRTIEARSLYQNVLALVPRHSPSLAALGKKKRGHT